MSIEHVPTNTALLAHFERNSIPRAFSGYGIYTFILAIMKERLGHKQDEYWNTDAAWSHVRKLTLQNQKLSRDRPGRTAGGPFE